MRGSSTVRWLVVVATLLVLLGVGLVLGYRSVVREKWLEPALAHEKVAAGAVEGFCAAQLALAQEPFFQRPIAANPRDASGVLGATLGWDQVSFDGGVSVPAGTLTFPSDVSTRARGDFMEQLDAGDLATVDTAFFPALHEFDTWRLVEGGGPLTGAASWTGVSAPLPRFLNLMVAAKVHLKRGAGEGRLVEAARDVRHAAWLAYSTETLLGGMVGLTLLGVERDAWVWAGAHGVSTAGWTPVPEATVEKAKKVLRAAPAFYNPMSNEQTFARAMACDKVTRCAALTEAALISSGLVSLLDEPWRSRAAALRTATDAPRGGCEFALARYWAGRPILDNVPADELPFVLKGDVGGLVMTLGMGSLDEDTFADAGR